MSFQSFAKIGQAIGDEGKYHYAYVHKLTTPASGTAGAFLDLNQTSGIPKYNAFAGTQLGFTPLTGAGNAGVYPGPTLTDSTKHLLRWQVLNDNTGAQNDPPNHVFLCDYVGFYPLVDCDNVDLQEMDNTETLPRYTDGKGLQMVLVAQAPMTATASMTITYTNSDGTSGRTTTFNVFPAASIGVCATTGGTTGAIASVTPFVPLAGNDDGVRSVESVQFATGAGGFVCIALVRPIASLMTYEAATPVEKNFGIEVQNLPEIKTGAYLNFLVQHSGGTGAMQLRSELIFVNS